MSNLREKIGELQLEIGVVKQQPGLLDEIMTLLASERQQIEKAYGGCHNCYGKGYASVNDRWTAHDTDFDIGSPGGRVSGGNANAMKFCNCDRGKQLEAHLVTLRQRWVEEAIEALPKKRVDHTVISKTGKMVHNQNRNIGWNDAVDEVIATLRRSIQKGAES